jgi:dynein light chain LC8-type
MLEGKAVIGETDMPQKMQEHAMRCASEALDLHEISDCKDIACYIKKETSVTLWMVFHIKPFYVLVLLSLFSSHWI